MNLDLQWDENTRRVLKHCSVCGKPTQGRAVINGSKSKPMDIGCAMTATLGAAIATVLPKEPTHER